MKPLKYNKKIEQSDYSTFGRNEFRNHHTGEMQKSVNIDWSPKDSVSFSTSPPSGEIWEKYLSKLPDYVILDTLTKEDFGDNDDLLHIYYGSQRLCPKARLSSLPESTLKKVVKAFN